MSWFKIDDELPDNRKTRAVRKSNPCKIRDVAPFGIWALAGAWSDDGFVPLEVLEDWDDDAEELAARLVKAGLWHRIKRAGEPGYVFHDWHVHNPAKGENDPSIAGTFGNHMRWHVQRQLVDPDCDHCPTEPSGDIAPESPPDSHPISQNALPESLPSRPDPTRARPEPEGTPSRKRSDTHPRFLEFWNTYGKKVDRKKAEQRWATALKKPGVTADLLIASAAAYVLAERENQGGRYILDPSRWLLNERWADERPARAPRPSNIDNHLALVQQLGQEAPSPFPEIGPGQTEVTQ